MYLGLLCTGSIRRLGPQANVLRKCLNDPTLQIALLELFVGPFKRTGRRRWRQRGSGGACGCGWGRGGGGGGDGGGGGAGGDGGGADGGRGDVVNMFAQGERVSEGPRGTGGVHRLELRTKP